MQTIERPVRRQECLVRCGADELSMTLAGKSVGAVKRALIPIFNVSYFTDAQVNGKVVFLDHVLNAGDVLQFVKRWGSKGSENRPRAQTEAEGLLASYYPDLVLIGEKVKALGLDANRSIDVVVRSLVHWCEQRFGPLNEQVMQTLADLAQRVTNLETTISGSKGQAAGRSKPGRRNTSADIAHCANDLKGHGKTWKEILAACKGQFPGRVKTVEQVRTIWRRHYRGKKK